MRPIRPAEKLWEREKRKVRGERRKEGKIKNKTNTRTITVGIKK